MDSNLLKDLREMTGAGISDVKAALEESGNDKEKAIEILRKKGQSKLAKKAERVSKEGLVESYIHAGGRVGVLVEVNCETDFVSRTDDFKKLAKELALHIAAANPLYVGASEITPEVIEKEREIYREQVKDKPADVMDKIIDGKLAKFYEEVCLMEQPFFRDPDKKVKEFLTESVAKMGEKVVVRRFVRYQLGV